MRPPLLALLTAFTLNTIAGLGAQPTRFADPQRTNQAALQQYSWKSRTEVLVDGTSRQVLLEQVRYDFDGRLQKTAVGGSTATGSSRPGPPGKVGEVRKRVAAKKKDGFRDMLADLAALAESYAHLSADRARAFSSQATATPGHGVEAGSIRIQGTDVVVRGDRLVVWVDQAGFAMRRVEIDTAYDGYPVTMRADYRTLEGGVTYPARSVMRYAKKQVEIVVETFDYVRSSTR